MPWKHVPVSNKGMITGVASTVLPPEASPFISGCYLKNGEVLTDFGYTQFPVPSGVKTNRVHGSVLALPQFIKSDGTSVLLALTTTNVYVYNTSTLTWDNVTQGTLVSDCETAWTANANVTSTADTTIKITGSKSSKNVIDAAFTTGNASYIDFSSTNLTAATAIHFWIYSNVALAVNNYSILLSNQIAGGLGAGYVNFNVPAIAADTWTPCCVDGDFSSLTAALSVSLRVQTDAGAATIYLDDIKAVKRFTGTVDNRFSFTTYNNVFMTVNEVDQPQKYTGSGYFTDLVTTLASGAITLAKIILAFKDHVVMMNTIENAATCPQRATWSNIGKHEDYTSGTTGYQDLTDDPFAIVGYTQTGENEISIYKEQSLVQMTWVGGQTPFRFKTLMQGNGIISKDGSINVGGVSIGIDKDTMFAHKMSYTGFEFILTKDIISSTFFSEINLTYKKRLFIIYFPADKEYQIWIPTSTAYPDKVWCQNIDTGAWYIKVRTMTGWGFYKISSSKTIGELTGTIGVLGGKIGDNTTTAGTIITLIGDSNGTIYQIDKSSLDNNGTAISSEYQTPDFILPDSPEYYNKDMIVSQFLVELRGQTATIEYSTDQGLSWYPTQGAGSNVLTLTGVYKVYQQDFCTSCKTIRFRVRKNEVAKGFAMRYYGFDWGVRSGR